MLTRIKRTCLNTAKAANPLCLVSCPEDRTWENLSSLISCAVLLSIMAFPELCRGTYQGAQIFASAGANKSEAIVSAGNKPVVRNQARTRNCMQVFPKQREISELWEHVVRKTAWLMPDINVP